MNRFVLLLIALYSLASCSGADAHRGTVLVEGTPDAAAPVDATLVPTAAPGEVGAACAFGYQCTSGSCSTRDTSSACGVCLDHRALGQSCGGPLQTCGTSATCTGGACQSTKKTAGNACGLFPKGGDVGDCDADLYCRGQAGEPQGVCTAPLAVGIACEGQDVCERGALCILGFCAIPSPDSCRGRECSAGSYCFYVDPTRADSDRVCRPAPLREGAACDISPDGQIIVGSCVEGTTCGNLEWPNGGSGTTTSHTCLPLPQAGAPCIFSHCAPGLRCEQQAVDSLPAESWPFLCRPLLREGESCKLELLGRDRKPSSESCAPGLECRAGQCQKACR